jgi:hypothetical protein
MIRLSEITRPAGRGLFIIIAIKLKNLGIIYTPARCNMDVVQCAS